MVVHEDIERELEEQACIYAVAESEGDVMTLSGLIHYEADRQTAHEIAASLAPGKRIIDRLEMATALPEKIAETSLA